MKEKLRQTSDFIWELDKTAREKMRTGCRIIGNKKIVDGIEDEAIQQLTNVACLPGVIYPVVGLSDMHWGYGLPMGAVAAFSAEEGIISSGLCGFDINCGVNSIRTNLSFEEVKEKQEVLVKELFKNIPCGVGSKGKLRLKGDDLDNVMTRGVNWAVEKGYGVKEDIERMEERGCMEGADASKISDLARKRGAPQLGTLGAGNHFLEIQKVSDIYDKKTAGKWGVNEKGQVLIMLHCGSRGLGHQVATDYLKLQEEAVKKYKIWLPDPQLACAPAKSKEGQDFFKAMKCAVNYSFTNRLVMTQWIRETFEKVFGRDWESMDMHTVYSIAHNVIKLEKHKGVGEIYVHRKGATRAFPNIPVLIAGTMGTASYLLLGTEKAMDLTFGSSVHGAGRCMSRGKAIHSFKGMEVAKRLADRGISSRATSPQVLAEESPEAYKNVEDVIDSVDGAGISTRVIRAVPMGVIKG
jgi:tRNA-splicing ligase RtcB